MTAWVFGYGSLMWRPDFPFEEQRSARLPGLARQFCRRSFRHRGTPAVPGMVVGLMPGAWCVGVAYRLAAERQAEVLAYLDEREGDAYRRVHADLHSVDGGTPPWPAWVYLPEPTHPSYAPALSEVEKVKLIATGVGQSGAAVDYLRELVARLAAMAIDEPYFAALLAKVERYRVEHGGAHTPAPAPALKAPA